jgi:hypothetical protein
LHLESGLDADQANTNNKLHFPSGGQRMKILLLASLFSLPVTPAAPPQPAAVHEQQAPKPAAHPGRWYMAETGHAVYCIGPVVTVPDHDGNLLHVATVCAGPDPVVALHD